MLNDRFASEYWDWLAASHSDERDQRLWAERRAALYSTALDAVCASEQAATDLISRMLEVPDEFSDWHARTLAYGLVEEAIEAHGPGFVVRSAAFTTDRGRTVASLRRPLA